MQIQQIGNILHSLTGIYVAVLTDHVLKEFKKSTALYSNALLKGFGIFAIRVLEYLQ